MISFPLSLLSFLSFIVSSDVSLYSYLRAWLCLRSWGLVCTKYFHFSVHISSGSALLLVLARLLHPLLLHVVLTPDVKTNVLKYIFFFLLRAVPL